MADTVDHPRPGLVRTDLVPSALLEPVVAYFQPKRVILFGSAARGEARPESDIDLLVILDDDTPPEKLSYDAGWEARRTYRRAADVIPIPESIYRRQARIGGTIAHAAMTEGIVVYDRET